MYHQIDLIGRFINEVRNKQEEESEIAWEIELSKVQNWYFRDFEIQD